MTKTTTKKPPAAEEAEDVEQPESFTADDLLAELDALPKGAAIEVLDRESRLVIRNPSGHPTWEHAAKPSELLQQLARQRRAEAKQAEEAATSAASPAG